MNKLMIATMLFAAGCGTLFNRGPAKVGGEMLDKHEDHMIGGCLVESHVAWQYVVLDLFTTGPIGLIIDGVTGNWKVLTPQCDIPFDNHP